MNLSIGKKREETIKVSKIQEMWAQRPCPLCNSTALPACAEVIAATPAESLTYQEVKESFVGLRHDQIFFSYYRCPSCNILYCPWYFSTEQLENLYSEMPNNLMGEDKSTASRTQSGYVRWFAKRIKSVESFLELGPDIGLVTREVRDTFHPNRVSLIEPNKAVHPELRSNVGQVAALEIVQYLSEVTGSAFELSIGIHVFDHLLFPLQDFRSLARTSSPGAHLGLVVHNEDSLLRKLITKKWPPFCLQHPQLYNPETLAAALSAGGWQLVSIGKSTNYFHLNHIAKMGLGVLGLPNALSRLVPSIETPINLGNMIALAVRN
ncbi:MAG: methyltransferase domain-containing protein [Actinobacteria bacterium]|nr:methyltransferase domain-containing protein [Actinomycetota bacterium]